MAITELPVQSQVSTPRPGEEVYPEPGPGGPSVEVSGYAWSGGGRGIARVDVSADGGKAWTVATLRRPEGQPIYRTWAWTLWTAVVPLPPGAKKADIVCKAVDASYNVQPESFGPIWNARGVLSHAWHRVPVVVADDE